jgi:hypothetical protein
LKIRYPQNSGLVAEFQKSVLPKRRVPNPFILIDPRLACLLLIILLFSLPFVKGRDLWTLGAAAAAVIACLFAGASVGYSPTSFISIVALAHLIFYPLAAWGNLLLPEPAVRGDLWVDTHLAMWGCTVGVLALALGARLSNILYKRRKLAEGQIFANPTSLKFNICLASLVIPGGLIMGMLGLYYHSAVDPHYNLEATWSLNLFGILLSIASCGVFLQTYRYTRTHSLKDLYWAAALFLGPIIVFLPSGSRWTAMGFLPLLLLAFWKWETNLSRKILALAGLSVILFPLAAGIGVYRNEREIQRLNFEQKMAVALKATEQQGEAPGGSLPAIVSRFSDYVAAGRIIADTPGIIPYRGTEGMEDWWQIYVPGFLNLIPHRINLNDGTEICIRYGVTQFAGGSSPDMIVGDLFSRWGWAGVFLGMMILGFILRQLDLRIFNRWTTFTIIFFVMFGRLVFQMPGSSVLNIFIDLARDCAAMALVSYFIALIAKTFFKSGKVNREAHYLRRRIA